MLFRWQLQVDPAKVEEVTLRIRGTRFGPLQLERKLCGPCRSETDGLIPLTLGQTAAILNFEAHVDAKLAGGATAATAWKLTWRRP